MAYSYSRLFEKITGRSFENRPVFDPPRLTPLRRPLRRIDHRALSSVAERNFQTTRRSVKRRTSHFA